MNPGLLRMALKMILYCCSQPAVLIVLIINYNNNTIVGNTKFMLKSLCTFKFSYYSVQSSVLKIKAFISKPYQ